ncbi:50S ribosomal protein L9 [Candidatus Hepatincolaceae symbiont of Richtersius coronifer]
MEIILLQRVQNLGQAGEIVKVKPGYARNFLVPNKMCLKATEENKKVFEAKKAQLELENIELKKEAEYLFDKLNNYQINIVSTAGESGHLYGSVKSQDISKALTENGFTTAKSQIVIKNPIKTLGVFEIGVVLHPEVTANILVSVARSNEEAIIQTAAYLKSKEAPKALEEGEQVADQMLTKENHTPAKENNKKSNFKNSAKEADLNQKHLNQADK